MNKHISTLTVLITSCFFLHLAASQRCNRLDQCRCETLDGSGIIDLNSLAVPADEAPRWTLEGGDGWLYSYNPCIGFDSIQFTNLAVLQQSNSSSEEYELGSQYYEDFSYSITAGLAITYYSYDNARSTDVFLICTPGLTEHNIQFIGETYITQYDFILESPCACPGMCDANGIIDPVTATTTDSNQDITSTAPPEATTTSAGNLPDTTTTPSVTTIPGQTTTPGDTTGSCDCCANSLSYWDDVGAGIVSLLFHDLILVFVIVCAILVVKFVFKKNLACFVDDDVSLRYKQSTA